MILKTPLPLLRAPATLDQMRSRSPELGRSPFWERSSRALPDPEFAPASETSRPSHSPGCQIAPVGSLIIIGGLLAILGDLSPAPPLEGPQSHLGYALISLGRVLINAQIAAPFYCPSYIGCLKNTGYQ